MAWILPSSRQPKIVRSEAPAIRDATATGANAELVAQAAHQPSAATARLKRPAPAASLNRNPRSLLGQD